MAMWHRLLLCGVLALCLSHLAFADDDAEEAKEKELQWLKSEHEKLLALQQEKRKVEHINDHEDKVEIDDIDVLVKERDAQNDKFERIEEENLMLRVMLEEDNCSVSTSTIEELERRFASIIEIKETEILALIQEKNDLEVQNGILEEKVQTLLGKLRLSQSLNKDDQVSSSGIDKLKKKRDRKKKSIEERLKNYENTHLS